MSVELFGFNIDTCSFEEAICESKNLIDGRNVSQVVTINPEMIEFADKDSDFANIIKDAELVIPDGVGVKLALQINGVKVNRIPGIDFAKRLLEEAAGCNIPVAIIGATEEVVTKAVRNLCEEISGLNVVYYRNGYFDEDSEVYEALNSKSPKLILVAMGAPRQEQFIYNAKSVLNPCLMVGIGGSLDVWSGAVKRAPRIFQLLGLEWLYRIVTQPSRIKRVFPTLPLFLLKAFNYRFSK